jgi:hypothetical protein
MDSQLQSVIDTLLPKHKRFNSFRNCTDIKLELIEVRKFISASYENFSANTYFQQIDFSPNAARDTADDEDGECHHANAMDYGKCCRVTYIYVN